MGGAGSQDEGFPSTEVMITQLRNNMGKWHRLAKYIPALQRLGYDSNAIEEATGLERPQQSVLAIAEQVFK